MAAGDGLVSMAPTSIAHSGTSASINADGGVDFTAVTSLSLNGVFTGDYDNYLIVISDTCANNRQVAMRLRASGSDDSGSNYTYQVLSASSTTASGSRSSSQTSARIGVTGAISDARSVHVYGPYLAQPTAFRSVTVGSNTGAYIFDVASTHSLSTAYDGFTFEPIADNITGNVHVFGYEE